MLKKNLNLWTSELFCFQHLKISQLKGLEHSSYQFLIRFVLFSAMIVFSACNWPSWRTRTDFQRVRKSIVVCWCNYRPGVGGGGGYRGKIRVFEYHFEKKWEERKFDEIIMEKKSEEDIHYDSVSHKAGQ